MGRDGIGEPINTPFDGFAADIVDNGYIQFTYVRIPRAHMLMKHTQVSREGVVTDPVGPAILNRWYMLTSSHWRN